MAKTLKERAEDYSMYDNGMDKSMFEAYRDGAEDQRKIDIEKAWTLFEKYATYIHPRKDVETCIMTKYKFIEAMEKE